MDRAMKGGETELEWQSQDWADFPSRVCLASSAREAGWVSESDTKISSMKKGLPPYSLSILLTVVICEIPILLDIGYTRTCFKY